MPLVFAYGTLKRGDARSWLLREEQFIAEVSTEPLYRLVNCGDYPGLLMTSSLGRAIRGELYEVSDECLARLDVEERVAEGLYARLPVALAAPFGDARVEAYFYLGETAGLEDLGTEWIGPADPAR